MTNAMRSRLDVIILRGARPYAEVMEAMRATHDARRAGARASDALVVCEHADVITIGKRTSDGLNALRSAREVLEAKAIAFAHSDRGGGATAHAPGQVVAYPIVALRARGLGARSYVELLEDVAIDVCASYGIKANGKIPGREGVWVGEKKIAAIGVKISGGVSAHGAAINVTNDLGVFDHIVACGLEGYGVTSVAKELGIAAVDRADAETRAVDCFARRFGYHEVFYRREERAG